MLPAALLALASASLLTTPPDEAACAEAFAECRALLVAEQAVRARTCFTEYLRACPDADDAEVAATMAELAGALEARTEPAHDAAASPPAESPAAAPAEPFSVGQFVQSGAPELVLSSTLFGAAQGFVATAALVSALRTREAESLPALVAAPTLGALAGLGLSSLAFQHFAPSPGDVALISSAMALGTIYGIVGQGLYEVTHLDPRTEAQRVPARFGMVLASGLLATTAAALAAPALDVDPGDIGLAHSGALWGAVLPLFFMIGLEQPRGSFQGWVMIPAATSLLAYDTLLALSPLLHVPRPATWLIEAGGVVGMMVGVAMIPILSVAGFPGQAVVMAVGASAATGVAVGTAGCVLLSDLIGAAPLQQLGALSAPVVAPTLLPDPVDPSRPPLVGLALGGRF